MRRAFISVSSDESPTSPLPPAPPSDLFLTGHAIIEVVDLYLFACREEVQIKEVAASAKSCDKLVGVVDVASQLDCCLDE